MKSGEVCSLSGHPRSLQRVRLRSFRTKGVRLWTGWNVSLDSRTSNERSRVQSPDIWMQHRFPLRRRPGTGAGFMDYRIFCREKVTPLAPDALKRWKGHGNKIVNTANVKGWTALLMRQRTNRTGFCPSSSVAQSRRQGQLVALVLLFTRRQP